MALTDLSVKHAKPSNKPVKISDGKGLYLHVMPSGSKLWRMKYHLDGKERLMSFGQYPEISLSQAREFRDEARRKVALGIDPVSERKDTRQKRKESQENSFAAIARMWWKHWKNDRSRRHADYVLRRAEADIFPKIGQKPITDISAPDLVNVMKAIEQRDALEIARRALQVMSQVFRYAIANGYATRNPAADIRASDVVRSRRKSNYARIDAKELPQLLRQINAYQGTAYTRFAMQLMALTFVRTSELIKAEWSEFDLDKARWDIPAARMKMQSPHIVPLSDQAVEILRALHTVSGHRKILFPGERDHAKPMSNNTILGALRRMGYQGRMTGHGFRGLASTILHELQYDHDHIELQLAHSPRDAVSAAYNHALHLPARAKMMQVWADYLDACLKEKPREQ